MICAIVLAAGRSRRMGTQKLLLTWGNKTVIGHVVAELRRSAVDEIFVVVPDGDDRVRSVLAEDRATLVVNPKAESEMLESVRCALRALPPDCEGVLVMPADQPTISGELVSEVVRAFRETEFGIIIPTFQNQRGHPMLFDAKFCNEVLNDFDNEGLSGLRKRHLTEVLELPVSSADVLEDLDTPEDYERLRLREFSPTSGA